MGQSYSTHNQLMENMVMIQCKNVVVFMSRKLR